MHTHSTRLSPRKAQGLDMNTLELTTVLEECLWQAGRVLPKVDEETFKRSKGNVIKNKVKCI